MSHLDALEAEAIHIMREVVAEAENPVMLYSVGKDSSVMLHLARKAFHPGKIPFPIMHIDTMWKFSEMIDFRDKTAEDPSTARSGLEESVIGSRSQNKKRMGRPRAPHQNQIS